MKKLLTTVFSEAVIDWGFFEGIRELIQNGLDAGDRGFRFDIIHLRNKDELLIYNEGASLTRPELLMGYSSKRGDKTQRGKHGHGFKEGILALLRCNKPVEISNGLCNEAIIPSIDKHPDYGNANVLCFNVDNPDILPIDKNKLIFKISNVTAKEINGIKDKFLQWTGLKLGDYYKTDTGMVLLHKKYKGKIFSKGIYVCDIKNIEYGYDFEDLELGRDRNLASDFDVCWKTSRIWSTLAKTYGKDDLVIKMLESNAPDIQDIHYFNNDKLKKSVSENFFSSGTEKSYPCSNEYQKKEIASLGYTPVFVSETHRKVLEPSLPSLWSLKEKQKLAKIDTIDMTRVFSNLISDGWKIKYSPCDCGGKYVWLKPSADLNYSIHGCICHNTPIDGEI